MVKSKARFTQGGGTWRKEEELKLPRTCGESGQKFCRSIIGMNLITPQNFGGQVRKYINVLGLLRMLYLSRPIVKHVKIFNMSAYLLIGPLEEI